MQSIQLLVAYLVKPGDPPSDIILIDGRKRVACIKSAVDYLSGKGVLILDNSERCRVQRRH